MKIIIKNILLKAYYFISMIKSYYKLLQQVYFIIIIKISSIKANLISKLFLKVINNLISLNKIVFFDYL